MKGGCVSTEAQRLNEIIDKNFNKVNNKKSAQQFQDLMRPYPTYIDHLTESYRIHHIQNHLFHQIYQMILPTNPITPFNCLLD